MYPLLWYASIGPNKCQSVRLRCGHSMLGQLIGKHLCKFVCRLCSYVIVFSCAIIAVIETLCLLCFYVHRHVCWLSLSLYLAIESYLSNRICGFAASKYKRTSCHFSLPRIAPPLPRRLSRVSPMPELFLVAFNSNFNLCSPSRALTTKLAWSRPKLWKRKSVQNRAILRHSWQFWGHNCCIDSPNEANSASSNAVGCPTSSRSMANRSTLNLTQTHWLCSCCVVCVYVSPTWCCSPILLS